MDYKACLIFAAEKHNKQYRRGGLPYITHPKAVSDIVRDWGYDEIYQITALFHDLLEDTDATEEQLLSLSCPEVVQAVKLLTKRPGDQMAEYIAGIKSNPIAFTVKAADRLHNLHCAVATDEAFKRSYIAETEEWYMDFCPEIHVALSALKQSLTNEVK
ncbi:MAG: HD domain-containing protein [Clostridia bacterium]|nr:HD domain-containing protein [Clostridia bacterium]